MTTSMSSVSMGLISHQITQTAHPKANEKTAAAEIKAEEQQQAENVSMPRVHIGRSPMDLRLFSIHQAADAGLLRPVWLETLDMVDLDLPRMRDLMERAVEFKEEPKERFPDGTGPSKEDAILVGQPEQTSPEDAVLVGSSKRVALEDAVLTGQSEHSSSEVKSTPSGTVQAQTPASSE